MNQRQNSSNIPLYGVGGKWRAQTNVVGGKQLTRVPISATQAKNMINDRWCEVKWGCPANLRNMVYALSQPKCTTSAVGGDFMNENDDASSDIELSQSDIIIGVGLSSRQALSAVMSLNNEYSEVLSKALLLLSSEYEKRLLRKGDPRGAMYLLDGLGWDKCLTELAEVPETNALKQHSLDLSKLNCDELALFEKLTRKALETPVSDDEIVAAVKNEQEN